MTFGYDQDGTATTYNRKADMAYPLDDGWAKLETQVVNGTFTLQRCIGGSDQSGVFLTHSAQHAPAAVALKLVPVDTKSAEAQLARWRLAMRLSHPHVLRLFQVGVCRVEGLHYLYVLMEYADQTLAQVLEGRALTEDEVREMLLPALGALECLHQANLAQGSLKPSDVLVVGDQLKLASDSVRMIGAPDAGASAADDVHALGATLCEALTRIRPSGADGAGGVGLPASLPASFREVVTRCLSQDPRDRPTVAALVGWLRGEPLVTAPPPPQFQSPPEPTPAPPAEDTVEIVASRDRPGAATTPAWIAGVLVLAALSWTAYRWVWTDSPPPPQSAPSPPGTAPPASPATPVPVVPPPALPAAPAGIATGEVMPAVSKSALDTIRGTLVVVARVSVDEAGAVVAATADDPGPSRYFERRSLEAARKWTFAPVHTKGQRSMRIRFAFTRSGVTAGATAVD